MKKSLMVFMLFMFLAATGCSSQKEIKQVVEATPAVISAQEPVPDSTAEQTTSTKTDLPAELTYPIIDTAQSKCYDNEKTVACPDSTSSFFGQDAQYAGNSATFQNNGDGTVTDLTTGLMWQQDPGEKMTYEQAKTENDSFSLAGYSDWRLPTIKELYSLILFDGTDVSACQGTCYVIPFIDSRYFNFSYGDESLGERIIDSQFASSTKYVSTTMNGNETLFGVNFADGRIKGYPTSKLFYFLHVRGNKDYGKNNLIENGDGTITDIATGLTWMQTDSGKAMDWQSALTYCENLEGAGAADWRLPNIKELHSIVDYSQSPATTNHAAIDQSFQTSTILNEAGQSDYPFYWSSTTHADFSGHGSFAAYISFGQALGYMNNAWMDVHGAGAQRSDPKNGDPSEYATGHGPQGDAVRIQNYARCVRGGTAAFVLSGTSSDSRPSISIESSGLEPNQAISNGQPNTAPNTPPLSAIAACSTKTRNDVCEFSSPKGTINGTCQLIQQNLACVPLP